jgi:hypothetical protein
VRGAGLDGAIALQKETERICQELGNPEGLVIALGNQALILGKKQRTREALVMAVEAHRTASDHGYSALAAQIENILKELQAGG